MRQHWTAAVVLCTVASGATVDRGWAQDASPPETSVHQPPKPVLVSPPLRRKPRPHRLTPGAGGAETAAPGADTAQTPGPGSAGGASGTAGGVSGARRVGNVQGTSAAPTTPTTLPPGTLDLGNGLTFLANYTAEAAGNPVGGIRQGVRYADQFFLGADADLYRLIGVKGAFLHAIGTLRDGHSLTNDLVGNSISVQEIYGGGQTYRLTYLSYEQKLFDDRVDIEVGRLPGQTAFLASPFYCNFQNNSICGSPNVAFADTNFTYFPAPTWAGVLKTQLTDKYFFNIGAYEVAPDSTLRTDHGVDFFEPATGFNVPFELGYATTFKNDTMPRHYGVGAIIDRSSYTDAEFDQQGGQRVLTGLGGEQRFGRTATYERFDQMVVPAGPDLPARPQPVRPGHRRHGRTTGRGLRVGGRCRLPRTLRQSAARHDRFRGLDATLFGHRHFGHPRRPHRRGRERDEHRARRDFP